MWNIFISSVSCLCCRMRSINTGTGDGAFLHARKLADLPGSAISTRTGHKMTVLSTMTPLCSQKIRKLIDCYHLLFMCLFRQRDIFRWGTVDVDTRGQMLDKNQRRKQTKQQRVHKYTTYSIDKTDSRYFVSL